MPSDLDALQGSWVQVAFEEDGLPDAPEAYGLATVTSFEGHHFRVCDAGGKVLLEGRFEIDDAAKTVDWIDAVGPDAGKILRAIYALDEDHFIFIAAEAGAARPTEFRTRQGQTMRRFVRLP